MKQAVKILLAVVLVLALTGCWNRRELDTLGIVVGIGIDAGQEEDSIRVTAQLVDAGNLSEGGSKEGGSGGGSSKPYVNLSEDGSNILSIFRSFTHSISRKLYIPHTQVLIFGEEKARSGIRESMDFFLRDHESRMTVQLLVAKGTAEDALAYEPNLADIPAVDISDILGGQAATSQTAELTIMQFMQHLTTSGDCAAVAPLIEMKEEGDEKQAYIYGGAIFEKDTMVGELDLDQTRGYLWVTDKIKSGIERLEVKDENVNMEIIRSSSSMKIEPQADGSLAVKVEINIVTNIASFTGAKDMSTKENVELIKSCLQQQITNEIFSAKAVGDSLNVDIFGINTRFQRQYPKLWGELRPVWKEQVLPNIKIRPEIQVTIGGLGRMNKPDYPREELELAEKE